MKRFTGLLGRSKSTSIRSSTPSSTNTPGSSSATPGSPEAIASSAVRLFCESDSAANGEEEVLHLPTIVDAAESSPGAAAACANMIRLFLHRQYSNRPRIQYNAIMLIRILSQNPGPSFTRNFDEKFIKTVKGVLRDCRDAGTQQILRETLDSIEVNRGYDGGVQGLVQMWRKEKGFQTRLGPGANGGSRASPGQSAGMPPPQPGLPPYAQAYPPNAFAPRNTLPPPHELASRVEEARNTAKILIQLLQSTPPPQLMSNELVREFSERCQSAQVSMQTYINCDSPVPDDDTLQTLIETNEQLSLAGSRYQRAVLAARRATGTSTSLNPEWVAKSSGTHGSPPGPGQRSSPLLPLSQQNEQPQNGATAAPSEPRNGRSYANGNHAPPLGPLPPAPSESQNVSHSQYGLPVTSLQSDHFDDHYDSPTVGRNQTTSNPFLDPVEHSSNPPPLAVEPMNYGVPPHGSSGKSRAPVGNAGVAHRNARDTENAFAVSPSSPGRPSNLSPTANRPGPGPWHDSGVSPSYLGRQSSAANGLTMHGASTSTPAAEIDGFSNVGRDQPATTAQTSFGNAGNYDAGNYGTAPAEARSTMPSRRISRVDVAGTGGFRMA